jgi:hypothetical protein
MYHCLIYVFNHHIYILHRLHNLTGGQCVVNYGKKNNAVS